MHDELHPLRGRDAVPVARESVTARFPHADHEHHVKLYPETWMYQVRWQHRVPGRSRLADWGLRPPALTFEAETCWYTLHAIQEQVFRRPWEVFDGGDWVPMEALHRPVAASA